MNFVEKSIKKIEENLSFSNKPGVIIASPSNFPPYKYHWIRDSALVMRVFIKEYKQKKNTQSLFHILNYIESEYQIQNLKTKSGLGEPKIKIDLTPFDDPWGRPQNDGSALRGINMIKIYNLLINNYSSTVENLVVKIIEKDIKYILENYSKPSFDLWEENLGWHYYTRLVQLKFIKDFIENKEKLSKYFKIDVDLKSIYKELLDNIKHHESPDKIISSFDSDGNISKCDDSANILALCHIEFDEDILNEINYFLVLGNCSNLINFFKNKYESNNFNLVGRYMNDKYFDGHIWIICSLGLAQFYHFIGDEIMIDISKKILDYILSIDINLDLAEQYDIDNNKMLSAEKLTWNYSEIYMTLKKLNR